MKTLIEPGDIRKGDLIRKEYSTPHARCDADCVATEYRATSDAHGTGGAGQHYLLDRPKPAVQLPTVPTLGWLTYRDTDYPSAEPTVELGEWKARGDRATVLDVHGATSVPLGWAIAFTPAVAVPADALDELRAGYEKSVARAGWERAYLDVEAAFTAFLAAVTKAGEQS